MTLQLFQQNEIDSVADADRHSVGELPSTFTDRMDEAWNNGRLVASSVSGSIRKSQALSDWMDEVKTKTGENLLAAFPDNPEAVTINDLNARLRQLRVKNPSIDLPDLTDEELQRRADGIGRNQLSESARMARRETTFGGTVGGFLGSTGAALTDPVNMAAFPLAAPASFGVLGTALAWGAIAGGSQAVIEGLNASSREQIEPGYIESGAPALNVLGAAGMGSALGGGIKGLAASWARVKTGEWPRSIRDAGNVVENEAQIAATNRFPGVEGEAFHRTEMQRRIDELASGRPEFDQRPLPEGGILASYDAKLAPIMEARAKAAQASESAITFERDAARLPPTMERLSEVQLSEFRASADQARQTAAAARARLDAEGLSVASEREALTQRQAGLSSLQDNVAGLRDDLAQVEQRLTDARPPVDDVTQARLAAIEDQLNGASRETRALLENERAQINETLAKTSPEDRRLIASLTAERNGLQKALIRAETELAKSTGSIERTDRRLSSREQAIPRRRDAAANREASAQDAAATGLRRSVARLAEDGYGIRLPRDDAQALAQHVMHAAPDQIEQALRDVTEELVTRAVALRRETPDLPGIGRPSPVGEQRARVGYHTEEMRKGITAIAREVGYEMPREEAATIAAKLAGMTDDQAMAVLDELLLRPRTLAEFLPETRATSILRDAAETGAPNPLSGAAAPRPAPTLVAADRSGLVARIKDFVASALGVKDRKLQIEIGAVANAEQLAARIGVNDDLSAYRHTVDNYALRHALKQHGDEAREAARGQIAVTAADFERIPDILESPDFVMSGGAGKTGRDTIITGKRLGDTLFYVEEVRTGRSELAMVTMYKRKGGGSGAAERAIEGSPVRDGLSTNPGRTIADPRQVEKMLSDPDLEATVSRDLDRLLAQNPDFEIPVGAVIDEGGQIAPATRRLDDIIADAESRERAAKEIEACAGPLQTAERLL